MSDTLTPMSLADLIRSRPFGAALLGAALVCLAWSGWPAVAEYPSGGLRKIARVHPVASRNPIVHAEPIGEIQLGFAPVQLVASGDVLYAPGGTNGMATLDVSDPARPIVTELTHGLRYDDDPEGRTILGVLPMGDKLLVADRLLGFSIYDSADPLHPKLEWSRRLPGNPTMQAVSALRAGDKFWLCAGHSGLVWLPEDFDASSPVTPISGHPDYTRASAFLAPHWLLAADSYDGGMQVVDLSDPDLPRLVRQIQTATFTDSVVTTGETVIAANRRRGFSIFDFQNPMRPELISYLFLPDWTTSAVKTIAVWRDQYLVAGNADGYIDFYDLANPREPKLDLRLWLGDECKALALDGDLLYAVLWRHKAITVFRLSTPKRTA